MSNKIYLVCAWRDGTEHLVYVAKSTKEKAEKFIESVINNLMDDEQQGYEPVTLDNIKHADVIFNILNENSWINVCESTIGHVLFKEYEFYIREMEVD